jgi:hypothetical protein
VAECRIFGSPSAAAGGIEASKFENRPDGVMKGAQGRTIDVSSVATLPDFLVKDCALIRSDEIDEPSTRSATNRFSARLSYTQCQVCGGGGGWMVGAGRGGAVRAI